MAAVGNALKGNAEGANGTASGGTADAGGLPGVDNCLPPKGIVVVERSCICWRVLFKFHAALIASVSGSGS